MNPVSGLCTVNALPAVAVAARTRPFCAQVTIALPPAMSTRGQRELVPVSEMVCVGVNAPPAGFVAARITDVPSRLSSQAITTLPARSPRVSE